MSNKTAILCEDKHGVGFFNSLMNKLKSQGIISRNLDADVCKFYGPCNGKLERQQKAMANQRSISYFVIVVDADGKDMGEVRNEVAKHIPKSFKNLTGIVILELEIEEWLCFSLGIKIHGKPSEVLKRERGYAKHQLPRYVQELDMKKLLKYESFRQFVSLLN